MPLCNRVTPRGDLIAVPARGTLMGNRGRLHDANRRIVRRQLAGYRAWIICLLEFKGRSRAVMTPGRYTELFFLDEATALAAGHRPCGECRRDAYRRFKAAWLAAHPSGETGHDPPIAAIDRELHRDRLTPAGAQRTFPAHVAALPPGVFVAREPGGVPMLIWEGALWSWSPEGYGSPEALRASDPMTVLTPAAMVATIAAGYAPAVHESVSSRR